MICFNSRFASKFDRDDNFTPSPINPGAIACLRLKRYDELEKKEIVINDDVFAFAEYGSHGKEEVLNMIMQYFDNYEFNEARCLACCSIVENHYFIDGNKRTALLFFIDQCVSFLDTIKVANIIAMLAAKKLTRDEAVKALMMESFLL